MKKGFTLIELLAVIIILAVIALVATPIVLNVVEEAKVKADRNSVYGLVDAAKLYYAESILDNDKKTYTNGTTNVLDKLSISGEVPESGKVFINEKGQSALAVVYGNVCFTKNFSNNDLIESDNIENCDIGITETTPNEPTPDDPNKDQSGSQEPDTPVEPEPEVSYKCKRADVKTLHTSGSTKFGNTTTTEDVLKSGDAFDCDVDGDGNYNSTNERFYYVSDLYNTTSKKYNSKYAVLIYYTNTVSGVPGKTGIRYCPESNTTGPSSAIANLPKTTQWKNVTLSSTSRAILNQNAGNTADGKALPTAFSYAGRAARLLTYQELVKACGTAKTPTTTGYLDACKYMLENTAYTNSSMPNAIWLETSRADSQVHVWYVNSNSRYVTSYGNWNSTGVRPVIEVLKTDIDY